MNSTNLDNLETGTVLWKVTDLYDSIEDPVINQHIKQCEREAALIASEYSGQVKELESDELLALVTRLEKMEMLFGRLATYGTLQFAIYTHDQKISAFYQKIREVSSRLSKDTVFFELEWNKLTEQEVERHLSSDILSKYHHYLAALRRYSPHQLSQVEEMLLIERAPVGRGSWITLFEKVMGHLKFGEKGRTEEEVLADLYNDVRQVRSRAAEELTKGLKSQNHILTHVFNTLLADKMINDRLRKYGSWVSSMNLGNELNDQTVNVLIESVTSRYDIPQRYYKVKKDVLQLPELFDYDRYAPLPHLPGQKIPWGKCREIVLTAFQEFSPQMAEIATLFYDKEWIHAPVMEGKRGGAFAHPCVPDVHPFVMVNYTGNLRDVSTVAHELGHGIHQYLAAEQGYYNSNTPLVLAETASVFAELLVFTFQLNLISKAEERRAFICQKLESVFATVFRQVSMNRFEDMVHTSRRDKGELSTDEISDLWMDSQRKMFADSVTLSANYSIWWSYIPHFLHTPGYVYSYAFGELLVLALYNLYKQQGKSFVPKYINLLQAGGSLSPYHLVKPFNVDLDDAVFWEGGLRIMEEMLSEVE
jgi:oligoendopeptidase F